MQQIDTPIIHKTYELYRALHRLEKTITKMNRFTLWQRSENICLDLLHGLLSISHQSPEHRLESLAQVAPSVDMLRVFIRLSADVKAINDKQYLSLQAAIDEIGRMLGGWIKSLRQR
jgi:hypothetical protein